MSSQHPDGDHVVNVLLDPNEEEVKLWVPAWRTPWWSVALCAVPSLAIALGAAASALGAFSVLLAGNPVVLVGILLVAAVVLGLPCPSGKPA